MSGADSWKSHPYPRLRTGWPPTSRERFVGSARVASSVVGAGVDVGPARAVVVGREGQHPVLTRAWRHRQARQGTTLRPRCS